MKNLYFILLVSFVVFSCSTDQQQKWVKTDFGFAEKQLKITLNEIEKADTAFNSGKVFPITLKSDNSLVLAVARDWRSGFFPGELWYMYEYTQDDFWKNQAEKYTTYLEKEQFNTSDHDIGFRMFCSYGNAYRLTGNERYKEILMQSAKSAIKRYKPETGLIRSWDWNDKVWQYPVIIDNMMNLELLFWASKTSGDPVYRDIAVSHAEKTLKNHFREDNSSYHVVDYDTITGESRNKHTHQGYAHASAWSRGQAWGLYGFTVCYRETQNSIFLKKAEEIATFIFNHSHLPKDLIPYWDYNAPEIPNEPRDVSAAAITASALYELSSYHSEKAGQYKVWADIILENLSKNYTVKPGEGHGFLLLHSVGSKPGKSEVDVPLVYADYYFLEALLRKGKTDFSPKSE